MLTHRKKLKLALLSCLIISLLAVTAEAARRTNRSGTKSSQQVAGQRSRTPKNRTNSHNKRSRPDNEAIIRRRSANGNQANGINRRENITSRHPDLTDEGRIERRTYRSARRSRGSMTFSRSSGSVTFSRGQSAVRSPARRESRTVTNSRPTRRGVSFIRDERRFVRNDLSLHGLSDKPTSRSRNGSRETTVHRDRRSHRTHGDKIIHRGRDNRSFNHKPRKIIVHRNFRRHSPRSSQRIYSRIVWRNYTYPVHYRHGSRLYIRYVRPRYHRKYVFVSIGGYWPISYIRYYWYGIHPYRWYGCWPTAYEVWGDTYNYYTYDYNYVTQPTAGVSDTTYNGSLPTVDESTFEDVRRRLEQQKQQEMPSETEADRLFEKGVTAFEQGDYDSAAEFFQDAVRHAPDDMVLPFAYVQALFADEQYEEAAEQLRSALEQMPADEQGLFFPRGLYAEDDILLAQIEKLRQKTSIFGYNYDLPLLLSYQLIGIEQYDEARQWLDKADQYYINKETVAALTELLEKVSARP